MNEELEKKWREEFEVEWENIERKWSFPLGSHHKKLVKETALNVNLAACKKRQEEIESLDRKLRLQQILINRSGAYAGDPCSREKAQIKQLKGYVLAGEKEIEELKSFIKEATPWVKETERMADVLGHSWENATRAWLEKAEKIK